MGAGNNFGLSEIDTDYGFILNPDVVLRNDTIDEIIHASKEIGAFSIVSPIMEEKNYPNYTIAKRDDSISKKDQPFKVNSVDGFAMLLNISRLTLPISYLNHVNAREDISCFCNEIFMFITGTSTINPCKRRGKINGNLR